MRSVKLFIHQKIDSFFKVVFMNLNYSFFAFLSFLFLKKIVFFISQVIRSSFVFFLNYTIVHVKFRSLSKNIIVRNNVLKTLFLVFPSVLKKRSFFPFFERSKLFVHRSRIILFILKSNVYL